MGDFTRRLAVAMAARGARVSVLTGAAVGGPPGDPGVEVLAELPGWGPGLWLAARRWLARLRPDALDLQYQPAAYGLRAWVNLLPTYLRASGPESLLAVTFHDLRPPYLFPKAGPLRGLATRLLARSASLAIATNQEDLARLRGWRRQSPTVLIPIGANVEPPRGARRTARARAALGADGDTFLVGHFGFHNPTKGLDDLLRAFHLLLRRQPRARLAMIGERYGSADPTNLQYARRIDALVAELGLGECLRWTGYQEPPALSARLKALDVCVLPYTEGLSLRHGTFMAALAHGLPIVTTYGSAIGSVSLVPPRDPAALAERLAWLAEHPEERRRLAVAARRLAHRFSWDTIAGETLELFERARRR